MPMIAFTVLGITVTWLQVVSATSTLIALPFNIEKAAMYVEGRQGPVKLKIPRPHRMTRSELDRWFNRMSSPQ